MRGSQWAFVALVPHQEHCKHTYKKLLGSTKKIHIMLVYFDFILYALNKRQLFEF